MNWESIRKEAGVNRTAADEIRDALFLLGKHIEGEDELETWEDAERALQRLERLVAAAELFGIGAFEEGLEDEAAAFFEALRDV